MNAPALLRPFAGRPFVLLDGAVGTELAQRGADLRAAVTPSDPNDDYWTGKAMLTAPELLGQVHRDYLQAGADLLTTNTFAIHERSVARAGVPATTEELARRAVALARAARQSRPEVLVAGSLGPLEACYSPELAPEDGALEREHGRTVRALCAAGADLILLETMNSIREARVASQAARRSELPFITSFTLRSPDHRLHTGEPLVRAAEAIVPLGPLAILINCCAPEGIEAALHELAAVLAGSPVWFGAQAHLAKADPASGSSHPGNCSPRQYVEHARRWLERGARLLGGCCGTTPAYTRALAEMRDHLEGDAHEQPE